MPVSEAIKEELRPYSGKFVRIDAKKVYQPINPGDGLIQKLEIVDSNELSPLRPEERTRVSAIEMRLRLQADSTGSPFLLLDLTNKSNETLAPLDLALTIFAKRNKGRSWPEVSDDNSYAYMTRRHLRDLVESSDKQSGINLENAPANFDIQPQKIRTLKLAIHLRRGEYQVIVGNGGGVHGSLVRVSNPVSFDISQSGAALLVE